MKTKPINSDFTETLLAVLALLGILFCMQSGLLKQEAEASGVAKEQLWCTAHLHDAAGHQHTELPFNTGQLQLAVGQASFVEKLSPLAADSNYLLMPLPDLQLLYLSPQKPARVLLPASRHILFRCLRI